MCDMAFKDPDQGPFHKKMIEMMLFWLDGTLLVLGTFNEQRLFLTPDDSRNFFNQLSIVIGHVS